MQVLQAGEHKLLLLEPDLEFLTNVVRQAGFEPKMEEHPRMVVLDLAASEREAPLLLFDAADPGNLGWFSRCQFYVDGCTGNVLQTPLVLGNRRDPQGNVLSNGVRLQIRKELPATFRLPGKQPVSEQMLYALLFNFLSALLTTGVGVCGSGVVKALAGRTQSLGPRN